MSDTEKFIRKYVKMRIKSLENRDSSTVKARLARLRHGAGKIPGELPELWGEFLADMPEEFLSRNGVPNYAEWAVYLSLTLFALHQQGKSENVHSENISLGSAAAKLMENDTDDERERVLRRFGPVITANNMPEFSHHLRCLVQLMSSKNIKLDYEKLAVDIYEFQFPEFRKNVQLRWGQDFYYKKGEDKE